jgi:hypothetical protein
LTDDYNTPPTANKGGRKRTWRDVGHTSTAPAPSTAGTDAETVAKIKDIAGPKRWDQYKNESVRMKIVLANSVYLNPVFIKFYLANREAGMTEEDARKAAYLKELAIIERYLPPEARRMIETARTGDFNAIAEAAIVQTIWENPDAKKALDVAGQAEQMTT